jgi:hypothetical protein
MEDLKKSKPVFFEDDKYLVSKSCSGEWGGTLKFKNKATGVVYACSATCPVSVNKVGTRYIAVSYLAHLSGSTEIVEIAHPESMEVYTLPPPRKKVGKKIIRYVGDDESKSYRGTTMLVDSVGVLTLAGFVYQGEFFCIVSDRETTYIGKIENKKIVVVQPIADERLWAYDSEILKTDDGHSMIPIPGGYIDMYENTITVLR